MRQRRRPLPLIVPIALLMVVAVLASADFGDHVSKTTAVSTAAAADVTFAEITP